MAEHHRKNRGDRHRNKGRLWNPDEALFTEAMGVLKGEFGWTMSRYLTECLKYVLGRRKLPPPRPRWAEEKAAGLPDEEPPCPPSATES